MIQVDQPGGSVIRCLADANVHLETTNRPILDGHVSVDATGGRHACADSGSDYGVAVQIERRTRRQTDAVA